MVAAPSVSADDVTRLLERREARPVEDVAEPSSASSVATLLARREGRAAAPSDALPERVEDLDDSPVEALLARRADSRCQLTDDLPVDAVSVAGLIAAREARAATSAPIPPSDALTPEPDTAPPSLDALLSRRDNRTRPPASPEETP